MDYDGVTGQAELLRRVLAVEDVLHVIDREVHLMVSSVDQFTEPYLELLDL